MRKVKIPKIVFHYIGGEDSEKIVQNVYNRFFKIAYKNILEKRVNKTTPESKIGDRN